MAISVRVSYLMTDRPQHQERKLEATLGHWELALGGGVGQQEPLEQGSGSQGLIMKVPYFYFIFGLFVSVHLKFLLYKIGGLGSSYTVSP